MQSEDPQRIGPYDVIGRLGEGGQGVVYLGRHTDGDQPDRAIKLLHVQLSERDSARARFIREAHAAMRVSQLCTARVIDADVSGDRPYIVSEYVRGPSLQDLIKADGPRSGRELEELARGTASALAAIHDAGIVHRDFKPHNVLVGPEGPRVIDFGLARTLDAAASLTSGAVGTPAYMAPEQLGGNTVGPAADVFAWGATIVYTASGRPPFGSDTIPAVVSRILHGEPELDALPDWLRTLVAAALAKDAAERPAARQMVRHLLTPDQPYQPTFSSHVLFTGADTVDPLPQNHQTKPPPRRVAPPPALAAPAGANRDTEPRQPASPTGSRGAASDPGGRPMGALGTPTDQPYAPGRTEISAPGRHRASANPQPRAWVIAAIAAAVVVFLVACVLLIASLFGGNDDPGGTGDPGAPGAAPAPGTSQPVRPRPGVSAGEGRRPQRGGPVRLGTANPTGYCISINQGNAVFRTRWLCESDPARPGQGTPFSMTTVCRWQYDRIGARAVLVGNYGDSAAWRCVA